MSTGLINCSTGKALLNCSTGKALLRCDAPATFSTKAVAHIRSGVVGAQDWELGLGLNTSTIANVAHYVWPNNEWKPWSLAFSGPGGTLTLTVDTSSVVWTPGAAIANDSSQWKLLLELYAAAGYTAQIGTQNVKLTIGGQDHPFTDMLVLSGANDAAFILPFQLGNQAWTITGEVGLGWSGIFPTASRLQAILRLQQADEP